jgi:hypothetical protein
MSDLTQAEFDSLFVPADSAVSPDKDAIDGFREMIPVLERLQASGAMLSYNTIHICASNKEEFQAFCRALGTFKKDADDEFFRCKRSFPGQTTLSVFVARKSLCKQVLLRTETVPEHVIPAIAERVVPAFERQVYGWECEDSILADGIEVKQERAL